MKTKHFFYGLFLVASLFGFNSCDFVDVPVPKKQADDTTKTDTSKTKRKILIEDYTGHTCPNCPKAAEELLKLKDQYKDQVIGIALHTTYYAEPKKQNYPPSGAPKGSFMTDYRTAAGNEYDTFFGINKAGLPQGMINRKGFPTKSHITDIKLWAQQADKILKLAADANIAIKKTYNENDRKLDITVTSKFLNNLNSEYKLVVLITQDSIQDWQLKKIENQSTTLAIEKYTHRDILRTAVNGTWGETISLGPVIKSKEIVKTYTYNLDPKWVDKHCHIVAFIYDKATYEILQAEEVKVK